MSIAQQFLKYLADNSFGVLGVSLFINEIPDGSTIDNNAICISSAGGNVDKYVDLRIKFFSVVLRNQTENGLDSVFENLKAFLHRNPACVHEFVAGGDSIQDFYIEDELNYIGKDANQRYLGEFTLKMYYERI